MIDKYNIIVRNSIFDFDTNISLPKELYEKCTSISVKVKYASASTYANVRLSKDNKIYISSNMIPKLLIILGHKYQVKIKDNEVNIGPIIGVFVTNREKLPIRVSKMYQRYLPILNKTGGVLVFIKPGSINNKDNTALGFVYRKEKNQFEEVKLYLPRYIYRRTNINYELMTRLNKRKINVYNKLFINKYRFYRLIRNSSELSKYLPLSAKYDAKELNYYLDCKNNIILKPVYGSKGYGISVIKKTDNTFTIRKNDEIKSQVFYDKAELISYVDKSLSESSYIISEYIETPKYKDRYFTIRVVVQLEPTSEYCVTSINAYTGEKDSDIGNNNVGETIYLRLKELCRELGTNYEELYKRLEYISIELAKYLSKNNHKLIDMGIDYIVDKDFNIYLLEVNKNHTHEVSLRAGDAKGYIKTKHTPIKYLIAKSGFKLEGWNKCIPV